MISTYLVACGVGKLLMYLWSITPYAEWIGKKSKFFEKLFTCHLCLGVWIFSFLAWAMQVNVLDKFIYIPVVSEIITGGVTSFLVFLMSEGWNARFREYKIEVE